MKSLYERAADAITLRWVAERCHASPVEHDHLRQQRRKSLLADLYRDWVLWVASFPEESRPPGDINQGPLAFSRRLRQLGLIRPHRHPRHNWQYGLEPTGDATANPDHWSMVC